MRVTDAPVFGARCHVVYGDNEKSTVTVSLAPDEESAKNADRFGTLAYASPAGTKTVSSILVSTGNQPQADAAMEISQMLAAILQRPVFVNTSLGAANVMLLKSVKEYSLELTGKDEK